MKIEDLYKLYLESSGVSTDTRKIKEGSIFFALKGDNFNANEFAEQALQKGAKIAVIDEEKYENEHFVLVKDVLETLQHLARFHRKQLGIPIIALTGSNGKTTTKELINATLSKKYKTTATFGNLNNHIGVPLTLLSMTSETEVGIVEMGANHQREIAFLCEIALPDYGYITNFGKAHLEGFGSIEGVIKGKSELYDSLKARQKTLFLNLDDPIQRKQLS
ncbi:MAG TPA: UDP-N-acetylmuramoyl-tripeptide--D-alanyl-D-alanine ligase, partial [Salinimicrobium catena]|nr:UDP-N-acetylmuramoyl-tripeptide--D-alanyl-D-alanine ligase [Salinimicrobium catena]